MSTIIVIAAEHAYRQAIVQAAASALPGWRVDEAVRPALLFNHRPGREHELMLLAVPSLDHIHQIVLMARLAYLPRAVLLLTSRTEPAPWSRGLPTGVVGCLPSDASAEILQAAIKLVLAGGMLFPSQLVAPPTGPPPACRPPTPVAEAAVLPEQVARRESAVLGLTPRQYEVLVLMARGCSLKEIGRQLNIAVPTAKVHAETVYQRLRVHNRTEAVYAAISRGATLGWSSMAREPVTSG